MLSQITPLILTYNEAPNIGRTLEKLRWARDIVVVDSFSSDETVEIVSRFPQARIFQRKFDSHDQQWSFGLNETGIRSDWILALDADYILTDEFVDELSALKPSADVKGFCAKFTYCINGDALRSGLYPPVTVLYRRDRALYTQDGHTHRIVVDGEVLDLHSPILHDDRKPLSAWFHSQSNYTRLEARKLLVEPREKLSRTDRIRRLRIIAPMAMLFYCLIIRGGIFDGWAGFYYAFQRLIAEAMLSVQLLENTTGSHKITRTERGMKNQNWVAPVGEARPKTEI
jgi:glycosyltransferase involved in cell wall biosynthesis